LRNLPELKEKIKRKRERERKWRANIAEEFGGVEKLKLS